MFQSQNFKISVFAALIFFGISTCLLSKAASASANNQSQTSPLNQLKAQLAENKGKVIYVDYGLRFAKWAQQLGLFPQLMLLLAFLLVTGTSAAIEAMMTRTPPKWFATALIAIAPMVAYRWYYSQPPARSNHRPKQC